MLKNISILLSILILMSMLVTVSNSNQTIISSQATIMKGYKVVEELKNNTIVQASIYIPLRNINLLQSLAIQVSTPGNPLYKKYLTYNEIQKLFLPVSKYEQILKYIKRCNLTIIASSLDSAIVVQGTVGEIEKALGINFLLVSNGSVEYYIGVGTPKIPGISVLATNYTMLFLSNPKFLIINENLTEILAAYNLPQLAIAYNATPLYREGYYGNGTNIGIIDFFGDPTILQQLAYFDKIYNLPSPPSIKIVPIGNYYPYLGIATNWAIEESLDVEAVHAMAPMANITIYNPSIGDLATIIGYIDQQHNVDIVSMSFGFPESEIINNIFLFPMVIQTEYYFMLGSLEGITFIASSGDGGGELYSASQPLGGVVWPASSPFVTAVGGTSVYLSNNSAVQEAWSYIPEEGGSTGGVSILFPKPWYQQEIQNPFNIIDGRLVPDIALNANLYPGVNIIIPGNISIIVGGTSESSQLFAGLLALLISKIHSRQGLINPLLYYLAQNDYNKTFYPITFGYNLPWIAKYGYNLVTGLGAPNIGNLQSKNGNELEVNITVSPSLEEYFPNQTINVIANITYNGKVITNGSFYTIIQTLNKEIVYPITFNGSLWVSKIILPNITGITYVIVNGSYNGIVGTNLNEIFVGYIFTLFSIYQQTNNNVTYIDAQVYYLNASLANNVKQFNISIYYYNPLLNNYIYEKNVTLIKYGSLWYAKVYGLQPTATLIKGDGEVYGLQPIFLGVQAQSYILTPIIASPEVVTPNESIYIELTPSASLCALDNDYNVTASLVSSNGSILSSQMLAPQYTSSLLITPYIGYLHIPNNIKPGYYLIYLNVTGYVGNETKLMGYTAYQIYISPYSITPKINIQRYAFQGQKVTFYVNITYNNGSEVTYGVFTALVFPKQIEGQYSELSQEVVQVLLTYNASLGLWQGSYITPSINNLGNATYLNPGYYVGEFDIYVQGVSFNGIPTSTNSIKSFLILPYNLISNKEIDTLIPVNSVLENTNITYNGTLTNVIMLGINTLHGTINLVDTNITGTLIIYDSNVTMIGSYANNIIAINSSILLVSTIIKSIKIYNSYINLLESKIYNISPELPKIYILTKPGNYTGVINITANVIASNIENITFYLNGIPIYASKTNGTITFLLNTSNYPDGDYRLTVIAYQKDGLFNSSSVNINFYNNFNELNERIGNVYQELSSIVIIGVVLAIIAIILNLISRRR
ncbi:MAG: protease pro-enzyme activation domain-containing protein [Saccharolobus sp.]